MAELGSEWPYYHGPAGIARVKYRALPAVKGNPSYQTRQIPSLDHLRQSRRQCTTRHVPSVHPFDWARPAITISDRNRFLMPASPPNSSYSPEVEASGLAPAAKPPLLEAVESRNSSLSTCLAHHPLTRPHVGRRCAVGLSWAIGFPHSQSSPATRGAMGATRIRETRTTGSLHRPVAPRTWSPRLQSSCGGLRNSVAPPCRGRSRTIPLQVCHSSQPGGRRTTVACLLPSLVNS